MPVEVGLADILDHDDLRYKIKPNELGEVCAYVGVYENGKLSNGFSKVASVDRISLSKQLSNMDATHSNYFTLRRCYQEYMRGVSTITRNSRDPHFTI